MGQIELGDTVKCKVTGFKGISVVRSEFINGCIQYEVQPPMTKEGKIPEGHGIDAESLEVIKKKSKPKPKKRQGGANTPSRSMRGF